MKRQKSEYYDLNIRDGDPGFEDFYHGLMRSGIINSGHERDKAAYYHNIRSIPHELESSHLLVSGTNFMLNHLANLKFEESDIERAVRLLKKKKMKVTEEYLEYIRKFEFRADVWVVPEGQTVFPGEPLVIVKGSAAESLSAETAIIDKMTYATLVATRSSRVALAAAGLPVYEYGFRRSPNPMVSSWAAMVGGCAGTSNEIAADRFDVDISGTMAHAWVMMYENEYEAFMAFYESTGGKIFLIDTYDPINGAKIAIEVAKKIGQKVMVRLDSGDPVELVPKIMELNREGWIEGIVISDDMNVQKINRIRRSGIPVIGFGVGTYIVVVPSASSVYKLTEMTPFATRKPIPKMKVSSANLAKATLPGSFHILRREVDGKVLGDVIALKSEEYPGEDYHEVMVQVMKKGKLINKLPTLAKIMEDAKVNLAKLPQQYTRFENRVAYPVTISDELNALRQELIANRKAI